MRFRRKRPQEAEETPEPQDAADAPRLQDTTERAAMPLPLPGSEWVPQPALAAEDAPPAPPPAPEPEPPVAEPEPEPPPPAVEAEPPAPPATADVPAVAATPGTAEPAPEGPATSTGFSLRTDARATGTAAPPAGALVTTSPAKRPELLVGAAFVGGLALALIVRRRRG